MSGATGLAAFDAASWRNPPPRIAAHPLGFGLGLVRIGPVRPCPVSWESAVPPVANHVLIWRHGPRSGLEAQIAGREDLAARRPGRNGFLIPAGAEALFRAQMAVPGVALHLHIPPAALARIAEEEGPPATDLPPLFGLDEARLGPILAELTRLTALAAPPRAELEGWAVLAALSLLPRRPAPRGRLDAAAEARLAEFLEAELHRDIGLSEMAAAAGMAARAFALAFRAAHGLTPAAHLAALRLARAESLLARTRLPLADVALLAGFRSAAHLATAFRRASRPAAG